MKKVQSYITTTKCLMNSSLSFKGTASLNFLNDNFILILFGRNKDKLKKSLLTPYFKAKNHQDSLTSLKTKSSISFQNQALLVHPAGLEPATC